MYTERVLNFNHTLIPSLFIFWWFSNVPNLVYSPTIASFPARPSSLKLCTSPVLPQNLHFSQHSGHPSAIPSLLSTPEHQHLQFIAMARPKKGEDKPKEGAQLSIDVDSFVRTRDQVSSSFHLQSSSSKSSRRIAVSRDPRLGRRPTSSPAVIILPTTQQQISDHLRQFDPDIPRSTRPSSTRI